MEPVQHYKVTLTVWRVLSIAFLISLGFSLWNLVGFNFSQMGRVPLLIWMLISLIGFIVTMILIRFEEPGLLRWIFILGGVLYIIILLDLTWFIRAWEPIWENAENRQLYFDTKVNLVPLASVRLYFRAITDRTLSRVVSYSNLWGNLILLAPVAVFAPLFWKRLRKWYLFLPFALGCTLLIEGVQLLFTCGSFDVDDILLNLSGAVMTFLLLLVLKGWNFMDRLLAKRTGVRGTYTEDVTFESTPIRHEDSPVIRNADSTEEVPADDTQIGTPDVKSRDIRKPDEKTRRKNKRFKHDNQV